jgi:hypothetical protein
LDCGFREALAKDHLAVNTAVNFVVHILEARPGQIRRVCVKHLIGINDDGGASWLTGRRKSAKNSHQDGCRFHRTGLITHFLR